MDIVIRSIEYFALISGLIYICLEVLQKRLMWYVGIVTTLACAYSFFIQGIWGQFALNCYYVLISIIGIYSWKRDKRRLQEKKEISTSIHLNKLKFKTLFLSFLFIVVLFVILVYTLTFFETKELDFSKFFTYLNNKRLILDASASAISVVASYWLAKAYISHWLLWCFVDLLVAYMFFIEKSFPFTILYIAYSFSACYGFIHWKKEGLYLD